MMKWKFVWDASKMNIAKIVKFAVPKISAQNVKQTSIVQVDYAIKRIINAMNVLKIAIAFRMI